MPLRPDPLQELLELQERMNRLFDETLSRDDRLHDPHAQHGSWMPTADVVERADSYVVELELPGLERDDVVVQAQGDEVVVRGERRAAGGRPEAFHRLERRSGPFARSFRFPAAIDASGVLAQLQDGVLRLTLPKRVSGSRRVEVRRED